MLQTPSLRVHCQVDFVDYERFEKHRDTLSHEAGSTAMNNYFAYLFNAESSVEGIDISHMGIEGEFDLVAYFTTTSPSIAPSGLPTETPTFSPSAVAGGMNIQEQVDGTQLTLQFEGAYYDDDEFQRVLTNTLDSDAFDRRGVHVDTSIV